MATYAEGWGAAAELARDFAANGAQVARDKGVSQERLLRMRGALQVLDSFDHAAFYAVVTLDYAEPAAGGLASVIGLRADDEAKKEASQQPIGPDDDTPPAGIIIPPPEAKP